MLWVVHGNVKKKINQLNARKAFVDSVGFKSAALKDMFLLWIFKSFSVSVVKREEIGEIKVASNWFRCVLVVSFNISTSSMFVEKVA